jgi:RNase adapter protein RapZ
MNLEVVILTGMSGSGKSVALHALEDAGYYCVDNLPPELLMPMIALERSRTGQAQVRKLAMAMDARSASSLPDLLPTLDVLEAEGVTIRPLFLDTANEVLVRRFSETRRPHPLTKQTEPDNAKALLDTIQAERELLEPLRERSVVIDTSLLRPMQLRAWVSQMVKAPSIDLTLVFQSFAYKHGVPLDADFVFDARMLANPHYIKELRPFTGRDQVVIDYMQAQPEAAELIEQIHTFLTRWLPGLAHDQRSYVTVAIGCTGGQHRSVYCVEQLAQRFAADHEVVLKRHREQDGR